MNLKIERDAFFDNLTVTNLRVNYINGGPYSPGGGGSGGERAVGLSNSVSLPISTILILPLFNSSSILYNGNINLTGNKSYYIKCVVENVVFANHIGNATFQVFNNVFPVSAPLTIMGGGQLHPSYGFQTINFVYSPVSNVQLQFRLVNSSNLLSIGRVYVDVSVK
jgi:hypothetical protein